jgi:hypothetical protein
MVNKQVRKVMRHRYFNLLLIVFIALSQLNLTSVKAAIGDSVLNGIRLETKVVYGSVFPHNSGVAYLLEKNLVGAEVSLSTQSSGRHMWEELYRYPRYGISYYYLNLGNPEILGNLHAFFGFVDIPFYQSNNIFTFSYQLDFGLGYFTKTFDSYENPLNHIVSSPYNVYIGFDLSGRFKVGEKNEVKTALELFHCSNGKTRTPNLGLNSITLSAAWLYSLKPETGVRKHVSTDGYRKHYIELIANVGGKRDDNLRDEVYLVSSLIGDYYYACWPKYSFGLGIDAFYDASLSQHREFFQNLPTDNSTNYQFGAHLGFRARYGRLHILLNAGQYIIYDYLRHGNIYSRIGLRYALTENVLLNVTLKAHSTIADFIEWGVGYRINTKGK